MTSTRTSSKGSIDSVTAKPTAKPSPGHPVDQEDLFPETHGSEPPSLEALAVAKAEKETNRRADLCQAGREELAWLAATLVRIAARSTPDEIPVGAVEDRPFPLGRRPVSSELIDARMRVLEACPLTVPLPVVFKDPRRPSSLAVVDGQSWITAARGLPLMMMTMIVVRCDEGRARLLAHALNARETRPLIRKTALAMELFAAQPALLTQPVRALTTFFGCAKSTVHRARLKHKVPGPDNEVETPPSEAPCPPASPAPTSKSAVAEPPASKVSSPPRSNAIPVPIPAPSPAISPDEVRRVAAATWLVFSGFDAKQRSQLEALLGGIEGAARRLKLADPTMVYPVLNALMPQRAR